MKKTTLLGLSLIAAMAVSAQTTVLKDVEHNLKSSSPNPAQALKDIQPAMTNPETANLAETWVLGGRAGIGVFDDTYQRLTLGQSVDNPTQLAAADALLNGINYYLHALPLDSVADKKGKIKTKYSKEIIKAIKENYRLLDQAASWAWSAGDYAKSYDLFEKQLELQGNPALGKNAIPVEADTIRATTMWNQAIAMLLTQDYGRALAKLRDMEGKGYYPDEYFEYAVAAAQSSGDEDAAIEFAQKAVDKYGASNANFVAPIINGYLNKKDYTAAYKFANDAIAAAPADATELRAQLYDILGTIADNEEKLDEAEAHFRKSVEEKPDYAKGWYDIGRIVHNRALAIDNEIETEADRKAKVYPLELEAAGYFEKAYNLDESQSNIPGILYRIYYFLGDEEKANYWNNL